MNLLEFDSFSLLDAIHFHEELNPELFNGDRLKPQVHDQLLLIAQDFVDHLGINDIEVQDITLSGSNAAYSYTKHSDIDLHILVDMSKFNNDPVYREFFDAKKTIYNDTHSITIGGIDVELYVQDSNEPVISLGEYSILRDSWIKLPRKRKAHISQVATKNKYRKLYKLAEYAMRSSDSHKIKYVLKTIKKYRQAGLDEGGEFSPENLAFKILRSKGIIKRLYEKLQTLHDKKLSLPESVNKDFLYEPKALSKVVKFGGYVFRVQNTLNGFDYIPGMFITAYDPKLPKNEQIVGTAELVLHQDENDSWLESDDTMVDDSHQGKGIAAMMYAVAKSLGFSVRPSKYQTVAGNKMWKKWGKDAKHLMKENINEAVDTNTLNPNFKHKMKFGRYIYIATGTEGANTYTSKGYDWGEDSPGLTIEVFDPYNSTKNPIAYTNFIAHRDKNGEHWLESDMTRVEPDYRGQNIAYQIYAYAKMLGNDIKKSTDNEGELNQTKLGKKMWRGWGKDNLNLYPDGWGKLIKKSDAKNLMKEASGYIPSEKERNDPRFKTALTVDITPYTMQQNAKKLGSKIKRDGTPPTLQP